MLHTFVFESLFFQASVNVSLNSSIITKIGTLVYTDGISVGRYKSTALEGCRNLNTQKIVSYKSTI